MRLICYKSHYQQFTPPFDIPASWQWVRLEDICSAITDGDHQAPPKANDGIPFLVISDIITGIIKFDNCRYVPFEYYSNLETYRKPSKGDILFTVTGSYGKSVIVETDKRFCFQRHIGLIKPILITKYLNIVLCSEYIKKECDAKATGTAQKTVRLESLRNFYIPIPPLSEQLRIIEQCQICDELLIKIDEGKKLLEALIEASKSKILDLAMQGKLVPQDPLDEPAADMLRRINPKAKIITDNPHLRNIPKEWCWVKLKDICIKIVDGDHNPPMGQTIDTGFYMISASNIVNNDIIISPSRFITEDQFILCNNRTNVSKGDVLLTTVGSIGRTAIFSLDGNITFQRSVSIISTLILNSYLKFFLDSPNTQKYMIDNAKGTAQKGFYINQLCSLPIPIPSMKEQERIVAKIEELYSVLDEIEASLRS